MGGIGATPCSDLLQRAGEGSPAVAATDTGMHQILERAHEQRDNQFADSLLELVKNPPLASGPMVKDQFGLPVNPVTRLPGYITGAYQALGVAEEPLARLIIQLSMDSYSHRRMFSMAVTKYKLADDVLTQYRFRVAQGPIGTEERAGYRNRIERLLNMADTILDWDLGLRDPKLKPPSGALRATREMTVVDDDLRNKRIAESARQIYQTIQSAPYSSYKDLSLGEIDCLIRAADKDEAYAKKVAEARRITAAEKERRRKAIAKTAEFDQARRAAGPIPRPLSSDHFLSPTGDLAYPALGLPSRSSVPFWGAGDGRGVPRDDTRLWMQPIYDEPPPDRLP